MGHRGVMTTAPENTISAYKKALDAGFKGTELDVMKSKDGKIICSHNFDLERVTDGKGYIFNLPYSEISKVDAAVKFSAYDFETIPLLEDALDLFPDDFRINIEIKARSVLDIITVIKVALIVKQRALQNRVIISSFNPLALRGAKWVDHRILTGFLVEPDTWKLFKLVNIAAPDCLHLEAGLITDDILRFARQRGLAVNTWTVNDKPTIEWLAAKRVDGIITDRPEYCPL